MEIALNIGRSRINLLSIALALFLFSTSLFVKLGAEFDVPAIWIFLTSIVPIIIGFSLTIVGLVLFLLCQRLDPRGYCEVWSFSTGELVTYLALAQTLSGCLQNFVTFVSATLKAVFAHVQVDTATAADLGNLADGLSGWLTLGCGVIWGGLIYLAPAIYLYRVVVPRWGKWALGGGYLALLLVVFWVSAYPYQIKARAAGTPATMTGFFVRQFWQPALWNSDVDEVTTIQQQRGMTLGEP